jgi:hypothetical protein
MVHEHSAHIQRGIAEVHSMRGKLFAVMQEVLAADNKALYPLDLITLLVAKRTVSTISAFTSLIEQHNMVCVRTLLRTQLDSMMRLYAFSLVANPHDMAVKVLGGTHIRKIKDRVGHQMTDAYLVSKLSKDIEWLPRVYERTSGFVHLSDRLVGMTMKAEESGKLSIVVADTDDMPEISWEEVIKCFLHTTHVVLHCLDTWAEQKERGGAARRSQSGLTPGSGGL